MGQVPVPEPITEAEMETDDCLGLNHMTAQGSPPPELQGLEVGVLRKPCGEGFLGRGEQRPCTLLSSWDLVRGEASPCCPSLNISPLRCWGLTPGNLPHIPPAHPEHPQNTLFTLWRAGAPEHALHTPPGWDPGCVYYLSKGCCL